MTFIARRISIIVALSHPGRVIGHHNGMPAWKLKADMQRFAQLTKNHIVIMGRKTWDSLPEKRRPLPDRVNIIVTRNPAFAPENCDVAHSLEEAFRIAAKHNEDQSQEIFLIGGGELYAAALPFANYAYLTYVEGDLEGDAFFPKLPGEEWIPIDVSEIKPKDEGHSHRYWFADYQRMGPPI